MKYRDIRRKLASLGCREIPRRGRGSHRKWLNTTTQQATVFQIGAAAISNWEPCVPLFVNSASTGRNSRMHK